MTDLHPLSLSRQLAELSARLGPESLGGEPRRARLSVFGTSSFPGKSAFDFARELPGDSPLRAPLLAWIFVLLDARVGAPEDAELARLLGEARAPSVVLEREASLRELSSAALRASGPKRHALWVERLRGGRALGERRLHRLEKTLEVARLLGLSAVADAERPSLPPELPRLAEKSLERAARCGERDASLGAWFDVRLASGASEGWPARLTADTTLELLGVRDLAQRLALRPGPLPSRLAPASFLLAFRQIGQAFRRTRLDRGLPFVVSEDAFGFGSSLAGDFFGLLPMSAVFQRRRLGLGRGESEANARAIVRAVARELDRRALTMLVAADVARGVRVAEERVAETTNGLFGQALEAREWTGLFPLRTSAAHSFAALAVGLAEFERAIEVDDEDFFESPRFWERLLAEIGRPRSAIDANLVEAGLTYFDRTLAAVV